MRIELDDVSRPQVLALLEEHLRNMHEITPSDEVFAFDALLDHILQVSRQRGYRELLLETGSHPAFMPARSLYRSVGFRECGPFGAYEENGFSTFMSLHLGDDPQ